MWISMVPLPSPCIRQGVDILMDGCAHNLLTDTGFLFAIRQLLRVKEGGLSFWGLPCNSFAFMARSQHQRTAGSPFGCQHFPFVIAGNILATRMVCLLALSICRRLRFFLEQPDRSMAVVFPYLMHLMSFTQVEPQRIFWWTAYLLTKQRPKLEVIRTTHNRFFNLEGIFVFGMQVELIWQCILLIFWCDLIPWLWTTDIRQPRHNLRWMGMFGGWSQKPELGLGNWQLGTHISCKICILWTGDWWFHISWSQCLMWILS